MTAAPTLWPRESPPKFGELFDRSRAVVRAQETFRQYVSRIRPGFKWYRHNIIVANVLQRVADGELNRVVIEEPPRHGKSSQVSQHFPAYYLQRFPHRWVGLTSYGADIAHTLSRSARENYLLGGGQLKDDSTAVKHWETAGGGGLWAAGFGGPLTGKGFHLGIIDDPVKDAAEAQSAVIAHRNQEWYTSTFYSRAEPDAAIVVVQTRWPGPADLVGWLFSREGTEDDAPERWHVVAFDALKDDAPFDLPDTCTLEPDWRKEGEALCPARYPRTRLLEIQKRSLPYWWSALYQQRPRPKEGATFKASWFEIIPVAPSQGEDLRYWDHAATAMGGDFTVGTKIRRSLEGPTIPGIRPQYAYTVLDVVRGQWASGERDAMIRQTAVLDGPTVTQWGQQEPGSAGKDAAIAFRRLLDGFKVYTEPATGSKEIRADPFAAAAQGGSVKLLLADWNKAWLDEVTDFPFGKNDDQVETAAGAYTKLAQRVRISTDWPTIKAGTGHG